MTVAIILDMLDAEELDRLDCELRSHHAYPLLPLSYLDLLSPEEIFVLLEEQRGTESI
jgi:hypothetical protein